MFSMQLVFSTALLNCMQGKLGTKCSLWNNNISICKRIDATDLWVLMSHNVGSVGLKKSKRKKTKRKMVKPSCEGCEVRGEWLVENFYQLEMRRTT